MSNSKENIILRYENASKMIFARESRTESVKYKKNGVKSSAKEIIDNISSDPQKRIQNYLDVGCGCGRICFELVKNGVQKVVGIDYSEESIREARNLQNELNLEEKVEFITGNFTNKINFNQSFSVIILHRVLCCYPKLNQMLDSIIEKDPKEIYLTIPPGQFIVRIIFKPIKFLSKIFTNGYYPNAHSHSYIQKYLEIRGYILVKRKRNTIWSTFKYKKK